MTNRILAFIVLFTLGILVYLLPVQLHDVLNLRYVVALWLFAEATFRGFQSAMWYTPLFVLVLRYRTFRDKAVGAAALIVSLVVLYLLSWVLLANVSFVAVKIALALVAILVAWVAYYGICFLFGTQELRDGAKPKFLSRWFQRLKKK